MSDAVDILLYVALVEEFDVLKTKLGGGFAPREFSDISLTAFFGKIASPVLGRDFKIAVVPAGKMGNTRSATVTSSLLEKLKPADVVVLGIAGSLSNDMEPGDVFIPDSVNEYLANSASSGNAQSWTFITSGNDFRTSQRLLNRFQFFQHTQEPYYTRWQKDAQECRAELIPEDTEHALTATGLSMRGTCKVYAGDDRKLASGPAVGKGKAFLDWLRGEVDRKIAAMEMESAGVHDATIVRTPAPRTVAIRGISDYADDRKEKIELLAKDKFRELSAKNALSFFVRSVEAGLFGPDANSPSSEAISTHIATLDSRVRSVFVIGGETGETEDVDAERPCLHKCSLELGKLLAGVGVQLIVCSPFPDSADYYTAMGYADAGCGGVIHFHSPARPEVKEKLTLLRKKLGKPGLIIQDWEYPGPETDEKESWSQAWLLAHLQALEKADAVVALGGKVSQSANTLLHLAEAKGLPIVPFAFLGGAAGRAYERRDWDRLNPGFDASVLTYEDGVKKTIEIANRLLLDQVKRSVSGDMRPTKVFISVARQDGSMAKVLERLLEDKGIEVLMGDHEIRSDQMITASIQQALLGSDICAVLWSRHYALSPWCFDELSLALDQQAYGSMDVWLFNLDDSLIVSAQARKLPIISVRNSVALENAVGELLA